MSGSKPTQEMKEIYSGKSRYFSLPYLGYTMETMTRSHILTCPVLDFVYQELMDGNNSIVPS